MSERNNRKGIRSRNTETDFRPPPNGHADWREDLERFLITAGTTGRKQHDITERFGNWVTAGILQEHLEALRAEGKAQKFKPPSTGTGRTPVIWRATKLILNQD